jgi:transcription elongation factor Elf1
MTKLLQTLPCPKCGKRTVSYCKRHDIENGRYRRCVVCQCRFSSVVKNGKEIVDKIIDDGNLFEVVIQEVDFSTTEEQPDEFNDDIPEPSQTWRSVGQMRKALILSIKLDLEVMGSISDETKQFAGQISDSIARPLAGFSISDRQAALRFGNGIS